VIDLAREKNLAMTRTGWTWYRRIVLAASAACAVAAAAQLRAAQEPAATADAPSVVAATVNGRPITVNQVERELKTALGPRTADADTLPRLRQETLLQLIDRELVLLYLESRQLAATEEDVQLAMSRLEDELQKRERTLDDYRRQVGLTRDELRDAFHWSLSWRQLLDRYLTETNMEKYFASHRRQFDGSRMKVAHILLKPAGTTAEDWTATQQRALQIRRDMDGGRLSFVDAARQFSAAPTADKGGDIGWIERHEPMPEPFSRAAFALEPGEISEPVLTPFGVHLIQCQQIEAGTRTWQDARRELEPAMAQYLFGWAADQLRSSAQVARTDAIPAVEHPASLDVQEP
jgi:parvulin-like peptidyl-prolyl isomerase